MNHGILFLSFVFLLISNYRGQMSVEIQDIVTILKKRWSEIVFLFELSKYIFPLGANRLNREAEKC